MKNYLLGLLTFAFFCVGVKENNAQIFKNALSKSQVEQQLSIHLEDNPSIFQWKNVDVDLLWNTLANEGDLVSIGYKPLSESSLKENMHLINTSNKEWTDTREKIINFIVEETQKKYGESYTREVLMPKRKINTAPNFKIRVFDKDIIRQVRQMAEVRYFEPATTPDFKSQFKSDSGCSDHSNSINSSDYTSISPASRQSWHHNEHNIPCAWNNSNQGDGIWVAVMDTGISSSQAKLNSEFAEGDSGGRVVEKYNSFETGGIVQTTNWQDQCGHGTAMAGLATAPKGYDNTPAGIAYRANLASYRVTEDVVINTGDEQDGVSAALYHAADDSRIDVISMSIGHVFSSGQVEDAINYAHNKGKLMFAAAGTSTSITSFYPVIFPAWMPETVAVTGIKDGSNRERCSSCHDGPEVDFVVEMQRASDNDRTAVTVGVPNYSNGYVGGSSAATASMAGMAALLWSNDTNWTREEVLTRLIQSADNYPARSNDFGWGAVDMCAAVSAAPFIPCAIGTSNDVIMEITNIVFPSISDSGSEAEWVISFDGSPYFFDVNENGASGDPANFINTGECGSIPLLVDLGTTSCTQTSLPVTIEIHEDDSISSNCDLNFGDDNETTANSTISFGATSFTVSTGEGNFVFTYELSCSSDMIPPAAGITVPQDTCMNAMVDVEFFATGGSGPYTATYSVNNGSAQTLALTPNSGSIVHSTTSAGTTTYTLLSITDVNGCSQTLSQSESVTVYSIPTIAANATDPTTCLGNDGSITLTLTNVPDGTYDITHSGGVFTGVMVTSGNAVISGLIAGSYDDLSILANTCESIEFPDVILMDPAPIMVALSSDSPSCIGDLTTVTASPVGMSNYDFFLDINANNVFDTGEGIQSGSSNTYSGTAFTDGDIIGVVMTDVNSCESSDLITVTIHPIPTIAATASDPTTCFGNDGSIALTLSNVADGMYAINYSGGVFTGVSVTSGSATITGVAAGAYDDLSIAVNTCESAEYPDVVLADPSSTAIAISTDAPRCPGTSTTVTATPAGMSNYDFFMDSNANGVLDAGESVQSGNSNTYSSTTFTDGDLLGVVMTDGNSCLSTDVITVTVLPLDYAFSGSGGLTGVELGNVDYETDGIIESTQLIDFSSIVDYDSSIEIHLLPGFETIKGAQFEAFIDGCDNGGGGQL